MIDPGSASHAVIPRQDINPVTFTSPLEFTQEDPYAVDVDRCEKSALR